MPNWNDVKREISVDNFTLTRLKYLNQLSDYSNRNVICYYSGWLQKVGNCAITDDDMNAFMTVIHGLDRTIGLDLILHTPGGNITATEQIIRYLLKMFDNDVRAIIPQLSMSAGTLLASSCKSIIMGKQSCLGPIDPQFGNIPCQGIIEEYEKAYNEIIEDERKVRFWQLVIGKYSPTFVGECYKAIKLSESLMIEFLKNNMLKGSDDEDIKKVVNYFSSHNESLTHSRHFNIDYCIKSGLKIETLEQDQKMQDLVLTLHHAYMYSLATTKAYKIVESQKNRFIYNMV